MITQKEMTFEGRVWLCGDDINTDLILPVPAYYLPVEDQAQWVFSANRPGWAKTVRPGDILIAGRNFGMGSSRPAARSLKNLGLACLVAESINGLFYRNAINYAFPILESTGVTELFEEGETARVSFEGCRISNADRGTECSALPMPAELRDIIRAGGIYALLEEEGLITKNSA